LDKVLPVDFSGTLQCDAFSGYASHARGRKSPITLAGCWAHVRRKFYQAREQSPRIAKWILRQIAHLYLIERTLRKNRAGPRLRAAVRASESRLIYNRLHRALNTLKLSVRFLPRSAMGAAIDYALSNWSLVGVYLNDGRVEIDNNLVENAIRPTAVGKKNWLFFGDAESGQHSAILYTIIESCRRRGIDPAAYLLDILNRLPSSTNWQIKDLTPEAWAKAQRNTILKAA
jgi:transposase